MITLHVDSGRVVARFERITAGMRGSLSRAVTAATIELQGYIRSSKLHGQVLNSRTGNLSRAVTAFPAVDDGTRIVGRVAVDRSAPYGRFQEEGVGHPWVIEPRNAKALRFVAGGKVVFAKRVMHPGLKARPFMSTSLEEKREAILARLRAAVRDQIQGNQ